MTCFTLASLYWILLILNFPRNAHLSNVAARTIELVLSRPHVFVTYFLSLCEGFQKEIENKLFFCLPPLPVCAPTQLRSCVCSHTAIISGAFASVCIVSPRSSPS